MANALYNRGRQSFLSGEIDWTSDNIKAILINVSLYTVNLASDQYLSSIPSGARVAISSILSTKTATNGVADADDVTFSSVEGAPCGALVLFKDTGTASTSPLIAYLDNASGLPVTPDGSDIIITWDSGSNKIFKL